MSMSTCAGSADTRYCAPAGWSHWLLPWRDWKDEEGNGGIKREQNISITFVCSHNHSSMVHPTLPSPVFPSPSAARGRLLSCCSIKWGCPGWKKIEWQCNLWLHSSLVVFLSP